MPSCNFKKKEFGKWLRKVCVFVFVLSPSMQVCKGFFLKSPFI